MKVTVLGCGSSTGVPVIGCNCQVCTSANPKNRRSRVSLFIEINSMHLLIDTSPDLRQQALDNAIHCIDAVLYTHDHADHTHGIDDLRTFNYLKGDALPVYGDAETLKMLQQRFAYAFLPKPEIVWFRPCLTPNLLPDEAIYNFKIVDIPITSFHQLHGKAKTIGYRIGNFSYSTDVDALPETAFEALAGTELWVVDCLRYGKSYSHSHLDNTLEWIRRVKPKRAVLTHMSHDFDYDILAKELPAGVVPGYDGLTIDL